MSFYNKGRHNRLGEHNERLIEVFEEATKRANLKFNGDKCECCVQSLTFIGDVVSSDGIRPDPLKVKAIKKKKKSKKDIQRFLGMVNYHGRYIRDLSTKTSVLRNLMDDKHEFIWGEAE